MTWTIIQGDARRIPLGDETVQCVVTSPPFWGLRDYGLPPSVWGGEDHEHEWGEWQESHDEREAKQHGKSRTTNRFYNDESRRFDGNHQKHTAGSFCPCGAWLGVLGLEPTIEMYVEHMVQIFREVRRVLRKDGTVWMNLGDSYWNGGGEKRDGGHGFVDGGKIKLEKAKGSVLQRESYSPGLKPKDLCGIPWRVALALQQPYHCGPIKHEKDRAWLAAFLDGEGTIGIKRDAGRNHGSQNKCQPGYSVFVSAGNQDRALLDYCVSITGYGKVNLKDRPSIDKRGIRSRRDYFGWWISATQAVAVLRDVYPFLIAKRRQAILAYTLDISNKAGRSMRGNKALPSSEQEKRERLKVLCNACNQRQPVDVPTWSVEPPSNYEPGWYLRSDIIWSKPNPMPESVTDRPTRSHEYVFLLTKAASYYYDANAVKEEQAESMLRRTDERPPDKKYNFIPSGGQRILSNGRNLRSVWNIATQPFPLAHFATFPQALVEPCIKAGTSEKGCCAECGGPWERLTEKKSITPKDYEGKWSETDPQSSGRRMLANVRARRESGEDHDNPFPAATTLGWQPTCKCPGLDGDHPGSDVADPDNWPTQPCLVLDPFSGSGTVGVVCLKLGRSFVGIELKKEYTTMANKRVFNSGSLLA